MTPLEASRQAYAEVANGNWDKVAEYMADDFVIYEPESLPYGGKWRGRDALQRLYQNVMSYWQDPEVTWVELVGGEKHTVAILELAVTVRETGKRHHTHIAEVTRFDDAGKMASMRIHYFDTDAMVKWLVPES